MCSSCSDEEYPLEHGSSFARSGQRSTPIFGDQYSPRRNAYQTVRMKTRRSMRVLASTISRLLPVKSDADCISVFYHAEDVTSGKESERGNSIAEASRRPFEILVSRHAIIEMYRPLHDEFVVARAPIVRARRRRRNRDFREE